jgi:hypothetical protein
MLRYLFWVWVQLYWVSGSHTGRYARLTSLGLIMYAQVVQSARPVESNGSGLVGGFALRKPSSDPWLLSLVMLTMSRVVDQGIWSQHVCGLSFLSACAEGEGTRSQAYI